MGINEYDVGPPILHFCRLGEKAKVLKELNEGEDVNVHDKAGYTALHFASLFNHTEIVTLLIEHGADVNIPNKNYAFTALHLASYNGSSNVITLLLDNGADINKQAKFGGTALHIASKQGHTDIVTLFLDRGVDREIETEDGRTALSLISNDQIESIRKTEVIQAFIKYERKLNIRKLILMKQKKNTTFGGIVLINNYDIRREISTWL